MSHEDTKIMTKTAAVYRSRVTLWILVVASAAGCSSSPAAVQSGAPAGNEPVSARVIETWLDTVAVAELMAAWLSFDTTEQQAIARHTAALGRYVDVVSMPPSDFGQQIAGREARRSGDAAWLREQKRRDEPASRERTQKTDAARSALQSATLNTLISFLDREVHAARISRHDHRRLSATLRTAGIPPVRLRKWAGPQPVEYLNSPYASAVRTHGNDYKAVLQEVRRIWLAAARDMAVVHQPADHRFYAAMH
jgi:hypothetical protein